MRLRSKLVVLIIFTLSISTGLLSAAPRFASAAVGADIVFVARAHLATQDDIFDNEVGPAGQFGTGITKFAPGSKLMIRHADGSLTTLVDSSNPSAATGYLIDVQSPDVSFDGTKIVFAGATTTDDGLVQYGWRLYEIGVNGGGFRKLPIPDRSFTAVPRGGLYDFGNQETYDWWNDLFPAYLADGRIVFASSRYPSRAHYDQRHTYNLYVVNADGTNPHRISSERGGLLHPTPLPDGRIVAARWWNNFNQPSDKDIFNRIDNRPYDQTLPDGTVVYSNTATFDPARGRLSNGFPIRDAPNAWHLMVLNPDGTDFHRFAFTPYSQYELTNDTGEDTYTGAQPSVTVSGTETLVAFTSQQDGTMVHSTQKTGIRVARPGATMMYSNTADAIAGLTYDKAWNQNDSSPPYALHPWWLPDGTILFSYAIAPNATLPISGTYNDFVSGRVTPLQGSQLQYQLYTMRADGSAKTLVPTSIGTADAMDAKPIVARSGWQSLPDTYTSVASDDPTQGNLPNTLPQYAFSQKGLAQIQTATLHNPNVYANPPLDLPFINNSPMPGSVAFAQVYVDANQFTGAFCYPPGYPDPCTTFKQDNGLHAVLWTQVPVSPKGEFTATVPADTPGFVVLRDANGRAVSGWNRGYISIAQGSAWARPGQTVQCIGCHLGHVSGSLDSNKNEVMQGWTNVAPYATVSASSTYSSTGNPFAATHINDRRGWTPIPAGGPGGPFADDSLGWMSATGITRAVGANIDMTWPIPFTVTKVRLVGPPPTGGDWGGFGDPGSAGPYHVTAGTLKLYLGATQVGGAINVGQVEPLANGGGTLITLTSPTQINRLTFTVNAISGRWYYADVAALQEIEVIGAAGATTPSALTRQTFLPLIRR